MKCLGVVMEVESGPLWNLAKPHPGAEPHGHGVLLAENVGHDERAVHWIERDKTRIEGCMDVRQSNGSNPSERQATSGARTPLMGGLLQTKTEEVV